MQTSYHVHSRWSDGEGEIEDFVRAAREIGLAEVGISDHYVLMPDGRRMNWSMPLDELDSYVESLQSAAGEAGPADSGTGKEVIIRLGIEADYFPETVSVLGDVLASHPFDYVIGAVHFVDGFPIDEKPENWTRLTQDERDEVIRGYWVRIREMAESRLFDIAAHLDLTKKFGVWPSIDLSDEVSAALDTIAASGMVVEVNTAGWYAVCEEAYPGASILEGCFHRGIPVLVTADAHNPANLTRRFEHACDLLRDIGYTELASYAGRLRFAHALAEVERE